MLFLIIHKLFNNRNVQTHQHKVLLAALTETVLAVSVFEPAKYCVMKSLKALKPDIISLRFLCYPGKRGE